MIDSSSYVKRACIETVAGTMGGVIGIVVGYPLDTVKILLQTRSSEYRGIFDCIKRVVHKHGFSRFYEGLASPITGYAFSSAVVFFSYGRALQMLGSNTLGDPTTYQASVAGGVSGLTVTTVTNPVDRVKIIMQSQNQKYSSSFHCLRELYRASGLRSLYYGLSANLLKEVPGAAIWFGVYNFVKVRLTPENGETPIISRILAGGLAGVIAWTIIYPSDVIRSRMMAEIDVEKPKYANTLDCFRRSFELERFSWCYKGYVPTVVRAFPVGAIILTLNDIFLKALNDKFCKKIT